MKLRLKSIPMQILIETTIRFKVKVNFYQAFLIKILSLSLTLDLVLIRKDSAIIPPFN